jgi:tetratricopeptide (TPR) repeat protein
MFDLFRRRRAEPAVPSVDSELHALEEQIRQAVPGHETSLLNRAGDLCARTGQTGRALGYYGRAANAYLELGRSEAAEAICRKILRLAPATVRAQCTLAWVAVGRNHLADARDAVRGYVRVAEGAGQDALAAKQVRMMADAVGDAALLEFFGETLLDLEDPVGADEVFGRIYAERNGILPAPEMDEEDRWARLLRAALMDSSALAEMDGAAPLAMARAG